MKKRKVFANCLLSRNNNVLVLTFDHVRGKKKGAVTDMVIRGRSIETIKAEIAKCEVVCFNCHMRREHKRRQLRQLFSKQ